MFLKHEKLEKNPKQNKQKTKTNKQKTPDCKVISDLLYMRLTYYTKDKEQGFSRLSNWFCLRCLRLWITNCLPHDGPLLCLGFLIVSWCERLIWWRGIYSWFLGFIRVLYITPSVVYHFPLKLIYSEIAFFILGTVYWHFLRTFSLLILIILTPN